MFYFTPFLYLMDHVFKFSGGQATAIDVSSGIVMLILVPFMGRWVKKVGVKRAIVWGSLPTALGFLEPLLCSELLASDAGVLGRHYRVAIQQLKPASDAGGDHRSR